MINFNFSFMRIPKRKPHFNFCVIQKLKGILSFSMKNLKQEPISTFVHPLGHFNLIKSAVEKLNPHFATTPKKHCTGAPLPNGGHPCREHCCESVRLFSRCCASHVLRFRGTFVAAQWDFDFLHFLRRLSPGLLQNT